MAWFTAWFMVAMTLLVPAVNTVTGGRDLVVMAAAGISDIAMYVVFLTAKEPGGSWMSGSWVAGWVSQQQQRQQRQQQQQQQRQQHWHPL